MRHISTLILCLATWTAVPATAHAQLCYQARSINDIVGDEGLGLRALRLNDHGQVTLTEGPSLDEHHTYLFSKDTLIDIGNLPGRPFVFGGPINNNGTIVGWATSGPRLETRAFAYDQATGMRDLGNLPGAIITEAHDINDQGQIVGVHASEEFEATAVEFTSNGVEFYGRIPNQSGSGAYAINSLGQAVGATSEVISLDEQYLYATVWDPKTREPMLLNWRDLWAEATDINDTGQIVGIINRDTMHGDLLGIPFLYENGTLTRLPVPPLSKSVRTRINNQGRILASSFTDIQALPGPIIYDKGKRYMLRDVLVNGDQFLNTNAYDINNEGQLSGYGWKRSTSALHALIFDPVPCP